MNCNYCMHQVEPCGDGPVVETRLTDFKGESINLRIHESKIPDVEEFLKTHSVTEFYAMYVKHPGE